MKHMKVFFKEIVKECSCILIVIKLKYFEKEIQGRIEHKLIVKSINRHKLMDFGFSTARQVQQPSLNLITSCELECELSAQTIITRLSEF